ncbi:pyridoxamine 5'-phosphate oxidase family protein [Novispirillum itersonii]|uniref:Pyridoxamine 5'-phosphate oxidase N-terminal domain-containing protein n=1 Tax=Novispirillum itersonii TaxID=189 RepID=A0A7W9ZJU7_NOVIT|nr:pyridoxamine 5'-phosphate oxidase family protein [Novispirillum itersonii]MBB6211559.1 hypothetical protein [Novispirillum itersonii]
MGTQYPALTEEHRSFIAAQKIFFVGTATADSLVNISPKGMDSFRVLSDTRVAWLNVTGSGNESAAHVRLNPRMTLMFCAFSGKPVILRLYGRARVLHPHDADWTEMAALFPALPGARQIFDVQVDLVQTSCGMAVPFYEYAGDRSALNDWATRQGEDGLIKYRDKKNRLSLDGLPTGIFPEPPDLDG